MPRARHRAAPRRRAGRWQLAGLIVVALALVVTLAIELDVVPSWSDEGSASRELAPPPHQEVELALPPMSAVSAVLRQAESGGELSRRAVTRLLDEAVSSRSLGSHFELAVQELGTDAPHVHLGGPAAVTPASLVKLLTTVAALAVLGPAHRFETSVVTGPTKRDLVLVGGGDPLLTDQRPRSADPATGYPKQTSLAELARETVERLRTNGVRRVRLSYDASLFSGPAVNPAWPPTYISENVVAPISALWVDEGRATAGLAARVDDPARTAALRFATLLRSAGLGVAAEVSATRAADPAQRLAVVKSPPLDRIIEHIVETSDNEGSEILLRHVALATGRQGSFAAGVGAVRQTLTGLGLDLSGVTLRDGSGLARSDELPLQVLLDVLELAADREHPELRAVVSSLPVAGFTGSLAYRFVADAPQGLGVVRAKTGTLTGVHGLAGLVVTRDGQTLVFAAVADEVPVRRTVAARAQLDRIAALLVSCGCSS